MDDLSTHMKQITKIVSWTLCICLLAWVFVLQYRTYLEGFIIGTIGSLISAKYLAWKVTKFTQIIVEKRNKRVNLGFLTRASIMLLVFIFAVKYKNIDYISVVIGLFYVQITTLVIGICSIWRKKE